MPLDFPFPDDFIASRIFTVRGIKVMLDEDLAELYRVTTSRLNEQVKRNLERFPKEFMFKLTSRELAHLMSQFATSRSWGGRRKAVTAFTEYGVLMLSSVLNSDRAIQVNIRIVQVFVKMNRLLLADKDLARKLDRMETKVGQHDEAIDALFDQVSLLGDQKAQPRKRLGYRGGDDV